jgi:hypothetical protein
MVENHVKQYSLSLQKEGYSIEHANYDAEEKYGFMPWNKELTITQED